MSKKWKAGDVAQLVSGGPKMTVVGEKDGTGGWYLCVWFDGAKLQNGDFLAATLVSAESPTPSASPT